VAYVSDSEDEETFATRAAAVRSRAPSRATEAPVIADYSSDDDDDSSDPDFPEFGEPGLEEEDL
jgi:hypothetical protein